MISTLNENLRYLHSDYLYHLGINITNTQDTSDIQKQFGDVQFVCMGGTKHRMQEFAKLIRRTIFTDNGYTDDKSLIDLCEKAHRYAVYKVGPVLCASHGIGMPSMSVLLHELIKLMKYAKCDPIFIRIGTSGGLGVTPGTVVVTRNAYNGYLRNEHEMAILGERVVRPAKLPENVLKEILECSQPNDEFEVIEGNTMAANCFYEGQGRLDGAICSYNETEKMAFLRRCFESCGIRNIEMEATMFGSLTWHLRLRAAIVCVTVLDRFQGDQVNVTLEQKIQFEQRPLEIVARFIKRTVNRSYLKH